MIAPPVRRQNVIATRAPANMPPINTVAAYVRRGRSAYTAFACECVKNATRALVNIPLIYIVAQHVRRRLRSAGHARARINHTDTYAVSVRRICSADMTDVPADARYVNKIEINISNIKCQERLPPSPATLAGINDPNTNVAFVPRGCSARMERINIVAAHAVSSRVRINRINLFALHVRRICSVNAAYFGIAVQCIVGKNDLLIKATLLSSKNDLFLIAKLLVNKNDLLIKATLLSSTFESHLFYIKCRGSQTNSMAAHIEQTNIIAASVRRIYSAYITNIEANVRGANPL
jgi:hypothetical protein